jgi:ABC-type transport system substrate-binding protein
MNAMKIMIRNLLALLLFAPVCAMAQVPAPAPTPPAATPAPATDPLDAFAWMRGCWQGNVNQRDFIEQWTAPMAGTMLGLGHTVMGGKTASFEFMRIQAQLGGKIVYIAQPSGQKEATFTYVGVSKDQDMDLYTFSTTENLFPARVIYRRTAGGMMFAELEGKVDGNDRKVIYPFRPVDCISGKTL